MSREALFRDYRRMRTGDALVSSARASPLSLFLGGADRSAQPEMQAGEEERNRRRWQGGKEGVEARDGFAGKSPTCPPYSGQVRQIDFARIKPHANIRTAPR